MATESLLTTIPDNTSILQTTKFTFVFPTLPFVRYFCQTVSLPGVSTSEIPVNSPFSPTYRHGDTLIYDTFQINAIVDEEMKIWEETYGWLKAITAPQKFEQYIKYYNENNEPYHDAILTINTNANLANMRIKFKNCHPTSLGGIQFNVADNAQTIPTADISFRFDYFELERL